MKNDPDRSDKLERTLGKELNGWTASVLNKKLGQLASIIKQMNAGNGPDILGVCEVVPFLMIITKVAARSLTIQRTWDPPTGGDALR